jgi:aminoglycoside phosphotransferase family enzyme/predicted kinase
VSVPPFIAAMRRPDFYPHRADSIALVQTHISYVLLAGEHVYKVKKPVQFSFLDFSTAARRRHFCHEEVRLNRRLAPDVYFGVLGICHDGERYWLGPEDDAHAVEHAVHMRRLPAEHMLDQRLRAHLVTPELLDAIARRLAAFHRDADAGPEIAANGDPAAVWRVLEDDFTAAARFRDVTIVARDDDAIQQFARSFLARHDDLFRRRQAQQRIRDGHGDLRAEHICCTNGLAIVDCVEFNPRFRYCDVASDIAFLAMDLEDLGYAECAARLVDCYVMPAADPELRHLLPFYSCYRAYVRGMVDSLKSIEEEVSAGERDAARRAAIRHFALAYRYTWAASPWLVAISGLSGSGKSAIAAALHARTGFVHINSDVVRTRLGGALPVADAHAGYAAGRYTPELNQRTYRTMLDEAERHLATGRGVILDATFQRREDRDAARVLARQHAVPFVIVDCQCSEAEVRRRLAARVRQADSPSEADWAVYLEQRQRFAPFRSDEQDDHVRLDTTGATATGVARIEDELRRRAQ